MRLAWLCVGSLGLTLVVTCGGEQANNEDGSSVGDGGDSVAVGSKPYGAGRWGHLDLAGPLFDWVMDVYAPYPSTCNNCAAVSTSTGGMRVLRGTGFNDSAMFLRASSRVSTFTNNNHFTLGIRCAKSP